MNNVTAKINSTPVKVTRLLLCKLRVEIIAKLLEDSPSEDDAVSVRRESEHQLSVVLKIGQKTINTAKLKSQRLMLPFLSTTVRSGSIIRP